jgi:acyl-CoA synthetase (AMP-forming)/AMP-acid ligase II
VGGRHVVSGYWDNEGATDASFRRLPGGERVVLTGDLGAVVDGEVVITGRSKDLLIIRGRNHYPQDIERTAEQAHQDLRPGCGVALAVGDATGGEHLVTVHEVRDATSSTLEEVALAVVGSVGRVHGVRPERVVLIPARTLPKTSSGKVQRSSTRQALLEGRLQIVHSWQAPGESARR